MPTNLTPEDAVRDEASVRMWAVREITEIKVTLRERWSFAIWMAGLVGGAAATFLPMLLSMLKGP